MYHWCIFITHTHVYIIIYIWLYTRNNLYTILLLSHMYHNFVIKNRSETWGFTKVSGFLPPSPLTQASMQPSVVCYNAALSALSRGSEVELGGCFMDGFRWWFLWIYMEVDGIIGKYMVIYCDFTVGTCLFMSGWWWHVVTRIWPDDFSSWE